MATIGEASAHSGVHIETIRYYERIALVPRPQRGANGRRRYGANDIARLAFIRRARELGFSLDDIRALQALENDSAGCGEARALAVRQRDAVRAKIRELRRLEQYLARTTDLCATGRTGCALIDVLSGAVI
jgi:MerR family mercuric resistance operon transcriptional regulator